MDGPAQQIRRGSGAVAQDQLTVAVVTVTLDQPATTLGIMVDAQGELGLASIRAADVQAVDLDRITGVHGRLGQHQLHRGLIQSGCELSPEGQGRGVQHQASLVHTGSVQPRLAPATMQGYLLQGQDRAALVIVNADALGLNRIDCRQAQTADLQAPRKALAPGLSQTPGQAIAEQEQGQGGQHGQRQTQGQDQDHQTTTSPARHVHAVPASSWRDKGNGASLTADENVIFSSGIAP